MGSLLRVRGGSFPSSTALPAPNYCKVAYNLKESRQEGGGRGTEGKVIPLSVKGRETGRDW